MADDMDDENELLMVTGRSSKSTKKRRKPTDSDDDEPAMGSKRGKQDFGDADSDDGLDEAERAKLAGMNELEREMYLYEKEEELQRARLGKAVLDQTREQVGSSEELVSYVISAKVWACKCSLPALTPSASQSSSSSWGCLSPASKGPRAIISGSIRDFRNMYIKCKWQHACNKLSGGRRLLSVCPVQQQPEQLD